MKKALKIVLIILCSIIAISVLLCKMSAILGIEFDQSIEITVLSEYDSNSDMRFQFETDKIGDIITIFNNDLSFEQGYLFTLPLYNNGKTYKSYDNDWPYEGVFTDSRHIIISYKDDSPHHDRLSRHFLDQLIYLDDDTKCAQVLYQTSSFDKIIYGNSDIAVIYNYKENAFKYINLKNNNILEQKPANFKRKNCHYFLSYYCESNSIGVSYRRTFGGINIPFVYTTEEYLVKFE